MSLIIARMLFIFSLCKHSFGQSRVNQGIPIGIENAPYMARLKVSSNATAFGCDASILNEWYLLTAGHCVDKDENESDVGVPSLKPYDPLAFTVFVGRGDLNDPSTGEIFYVSKVHFKEFSRTNDIAILKLKSKMTLDGITKIASMLPTNTNYYPKNRTRAYVDGWGKNLQNTKRLLRAYIYTLSQEECRRGHQICTLGDNGAGLCRGDSGGPLVSADDGVQIGLVSYVPRNCSNPGTIKSTFTAIAPNLCWIRRIMSGRGE